jgi:energy-coupling factor transporter ATP-binding protein EcfA2
MRLTPPPPEIGETDGFKKEHDLFGLAEFGERLANLVCRLDEPLVIALDGEWGSGKSTFVRQWAGLLGQRDVPVILFDAFANDHQEDAFISLAGEIAALAQAGTKQDGAAVDNFVDKAKKVGRVLAPLAVRASMRAVTLGLLAAEDLEGLQDFIRETGADTGAMTERLVEERLKQAEADRNTLEAFRQSLRVLAGELGSPARADPDTRKPLVFIIDELDRCKPPFALNLLERVKHLFSVENVYFVLVAHVPQLEAAIRGSYGLDVFDARTYLEKFFHLRIALPEPDPRPPDRTSRYLGYLWQVMGLHDQSGQTGLANLGRVYGLSLRTLERVAAYVALVYAATSERNFREACLVVGLCVMRQIKPDLFTKARSGALRWAEARDFLRLDEWSNENAREYYELWWRYVTEETLPNEPWVRPVESALFGYTMDRDMILPIICNYVENLYIVNA